MALDDLSALDHHSNLGFPSEYPEWCRTFFAPVDDVHGALIDVLASATISLSVCMYAFTDADLLTLMLTKLNDEHCAVTLTLDASQYRGHVESQVFTAQPFPASSVGVGNSERDGIIHMKVAVIDGQDIVTGSTNWSPSGQDKEDNQLDIIRDTGLAAFYTARLSALHAYVVQHPANLTAAPLLGEEDA